MVRWGTGHVGLGALTLVALMGAGFLHAACKDTIEPGNLVDASDTDDVDTIHEDATDPPIPRPEAGGEPPRRDAAVSPPADAAPPATDAGPG